MTPNQQTLQAITNHLKHWGPITRAPDHNATTLTLTKTNNTTIHIRLELPTLTLTAPHNPGDPTPTPIHNHLTIEILTHGLTPTQVQNIPHPPITILNPADPQLFQKINQTLQTIHQKLTHYINQQQTTPPYPHIIRHKWTQPPYGITT